MIYLHESTRDVFTAGLIGVVAKPVGGAMELISQTSRGLLSQAGLTLTLNPARPRRIILSRPAPVRLQIDPNENAGALQMPNIEASARHS